MVSVSLLVPLSTAVKPMAVKPDVAQTYGVIVTPVTVLEAVHTEVV